MATFKTRPNFNVALELITVWLKFLWGFTYLKAAHSELALEVLSA